MNKTIDLNTEDIIRLDEAAKIAGRGRSGKATHLSTVLRWILRGVPGPDGERIRLEALRLGAHWITSRQALQRFAEALTPNLAAAAQLPRAATARRRASERAGEALSRIGI